MRKNSIQKENFTEIYYVKFKPGFSTNFLVGNLFQVELEKCFETQKFKKILTHPKAFVLSEKRRTFLVVFGLIQKSALLVLYQIQEYLSKKFQDVFTLVHYKNYIDKLQRFNQAKTSQKYRRTLTVRGALHRLKPFYSSFSPNPSIIIPVNTTIDYFLINRELAVCNKARLRGW